MKKQFSIGILAVITMSMLWGINGYYAAYDAPFEGIGPSETIPDDNYHQMSQNKKPMLDSNGQSGIDTPEDTQDDPRENPINDVKNNKDDSDDSTAKGDQSNNSSNPLKKPSNGAQKPPSDTKPSQKPPVSTTPEKPPESPTSVVLSDIWNKYYKEFEDKISAKMTIDSTALDLLYGINADDLVQYSGYMPMMNVKAEEYFMAEVKDGKMDSIEKQILKRQKDIDATWQNYLADQYELVKNYKLVKNGNFIMFGISENASRLEQIFNDTINKSK